jgi:hypothetical protein
MFLQVDVGVTMYTCIREVPSLNPNRVSPLNSLHPSEYRSDSQCHTWRMGAYLISLDLVKSSNYDGFLKQIGNNAPASSKSAGNIS